MGIVVHLLGIGVATCVITSSSIADASALQVTTPRPRAHLWHQYYKELDVQDTAFSRKPWQLRWQKSAQCEAVVMCVSELLNQQLKTCTTRKCIDSQETLEKIYCYQHFSVIVADILQLLPAGRKLHWAFRNNADTHRNIGHRCSQSNRKNNQPFTDFLKTQNKKQPKE